MPRLSDLGAESFLRGGPIRAKQRSAAAAQRQLSGFCDLIADDDKEVLSSQTLIFHRAGKIIRCARTIGGF